jgi:FdhD protein
MHEAAAGTILRVAVTAAAGERVALRTRHRTSDSSCGLCGIENLEQALRPLPRLPTAWSGSDAAVFAALAGLDDRQRLNRATGAVHAAARCSAAGAILDVREDVGRHNAFDKLIGAMLRAGAGWDGGFALLSSRCSYELVEKAVLSGCPMLATISAPTDLAVRRAGEAGLALRVLARRDALLATP